MGFGSPLFFVRLFPHDPFLGSHTFIYLKIFRRSPEDPNITNTYIRYNCCLCPDPDITDTYNRYNCCLYPDLNSVNENHYHNENHSHLEFFLDFSKKARSAPKCENDKCQSDASAPKCETEVLKWSTFCAARSRLGFP